MNDDVYYRDTVWLFCYIIYLSAVCCYFVISYICSLFVISLYHISAERDGSVVEGDKIDLTVAAEDDGAVFTCTDKSHPDLKTAADGSQFDDSLLKQEKTITVYCKYYSLRWPGEVTPMRAK